MLHQVCLMPWAIFVFSDDATTTQGPTPIDGKMRTHSQCVLLLKGLIYHPIHRPIRLGQCTIGLHVFFSLSSRKKTLGKIIIYLETAFVRLKALARHIDAIWHHEKRSKDTCTPIQFDVT